MGIPDWVRNPWIAFVPLALVGFLGNPPWSYPTVPASHVAFGLRSALVEFADRVELCPGDPPRSQILAVNETVPSDDELKALAAALGIEPGGRGRPSKCRSHFLTTVVVPYRRRPNQLKLFVRHMHEFLMRQDLDYRIIVVNQADDEPFNRGALLNVGFLESEASLGAGFRNPGRCYVFHDVDLLPENLANIYACSRHPRHMSVAVNSLRYTLPYPEIVGGALAITADQFRAVNGFPTSYAGWGGEDDDLSRRFQSYVLDVERFEPEVARYRMLPHSKAAPGHQRFKVASPKEGLVSLKYRVHSLNRTPLYTFVTVALISS